MIHVVALQEPPGDSSGSRYDIQGALAPLARKRSEGMAANA